MLLIQYGAKLDLPDAECKVPLLHAILTNSVEMVKLLLQAGASVTLPKSLTHYITPPLIVACKKGNVEIVLALISDGVDIDEFDVLNMSALYVAVAYGHTQVIRALLQAGSGPNIPDLPRFNASVYGMSKGAPVHPLNSSLITEQTPTEPIGQVTLHCMLHLVKVWSL